MSETATEAAPATETTEQQPTEPAATSEPTATPKPTETVEFWKAKAREQENRAKANAQKAKDFDDFQESQKSEQQKIADRAAQAERERDEARVEGLRYKAAAKHGISEDDFDLLGVGDEEAIEKRATRIGVLNAALKENESLRAQIEALTGKPVPSNGRPVEALKPGATPVTPNTPTDDSYPAHWLPGGAGTTS